MRAATTCTGRASHLPRAPQHGETAELSGRPAVRGAMPIPQRRWRCGARVLVFIARVLASVGAYLPEESVV